mgnify:CR=1 FL=1|tara:strand:- start:92 stop:1879 length:1788 start_codon:yes stop_codon:yes gene_type:complete
MHRPDHNETIGQILNFLDAQRPAIAPGDATRYEEPETYFEQGKPINPQPSSEPWLGEFLSTMSPAPAFGDEEQYRKNVKGAADLLLPQTPGQVGFDLLGGKGLAVGGTIAMGAMKPAKKLLKKFLDKIPKSSRKLSPEESIEKEIRRQDDMFAEIPEDNRTAREMVESFDREFAEMTEDERYAAMSDELEFMNISRTESTGNVTVPTQSASIYNETPAIMRTRVRGPGHRASDHHMLNTVDLPKKPTINIKKIKGRAAPTKELMGEVSVDPKAKPTWNRIEDWGGKQVDEFSWSDDGKMKQHMFVVRDTDAVKAIGDKAPIVSRMGFRTVQEGQNVYIQGLNFYKFGGGISPDKMGQIMKPAAVRSLPENIRYRYGYTKKPGSSLSEEFVDPWHVDQFVKNPDYIYKPGDKVGMATSDYINTVGSDVGPAKTMQLLFSRAPDNWAIRTIDNSFTMDSFTNLLKSVLRNAAKLKVGNRFMTISPSTSSKFSKLSNRLLSEGAATAEDMQPLIDELTNEWVNLVAKYERRGLKVSGQEQKFYAKSGTLKGQLGKAGLFDFTIGGATSAMAALFGIKVSQMSNFLEQLDEEKDPRNAR